MFRIKFLASFLLMFFLWVAPLHAAPLEKVRIAQFGQSKFLLYLPLYVAQEEGFFAEQGLDVDIRFAGNDDQIFAAVMSGSVEYGMGDPVFTAIAQEKGGKAKTVAMLITNLALSGYTNKATIPEIRRAEQLAGLRVSSFPAPSTTYTILNGLKQRVPTLASMKIVQSAMGTGAALLQTDTVDISVDLEPAVSQLVENGFRVVLNLNDFTEPQAVTGLMVRQETINKNPAQIQCMVNALQEAITLMYKEPDAAYRTARKLFPSLGEKVIRRAVDHMLRDAMYPSSVVVPDDYWQRALKTRLDSGELAHPQATSLAVDNRFAQKAQGAYGK
ncbi:MAG: ABC transporter substrate-binding protein [Bdellovibrionales bacterium]